MLGVVTVYATRLARYLNQTAQLERRGEPDAFGSTTKSLPVSIRVRREMSRKLVRNAFGDVVASDTTIYCIDAVSPQDVIDGREVISVADWVDKMGHICGYEVYL